MVTRNVVIRNYFVTEVDSPAAESGSEEPEPVVEIELCLRDTLQVLDKAGGEVVMSQCCYEQNTVVIDSSEVDDIDNVDQMIYEFLQEDMNMDPLSAEDASTELATIITESVERSKRTHPFFGIISLAIDIDSLMKTFGEPSDGPTGKHGFDWLLQRGSRMCVLCGHPMSSRWDMVITPCNHAFHKACICQWFSNRPGSSCATCGRQLSLMTHGSIQLGLTQ
ncbi:hypothetical protein EJ110_NYTH38972 [Nymphaea thermarum]|nr:hypothetical protein EJ110_NYTH38972 [Nymphaea thermarum]